MAYKKHYTLPFRTLHTNTLYTINIYEDGYEGDDVVELTGAEEPFDTQMDDDDDFTKAYRGQTGHLNIVTKDRTQLYALMPMSPKAMLIKVFKGEDADVLVWSGYIQQQAMSQSYLNGTYELAIPIRSALDLWAETKLPASKTGYVNWRIYLNRLAYEGGECLYNNYYCPAVKYNDPRLWLDSIPENWLDDRGEYTGTFTKGFIEENFKQLRDFEEIYKDGESEDIYDSVTYGDVMDDFLKLHGYVLYEDNGNLILKDVTGKATTYALFSFGGEALETGFVTVETDDILGLAFASNDNEENYVLPKNTITIDQEDNDPDDIFDSGDAFRVKGANEVISFNPGYEWGTVAFRSTPEITAKRYDSDFNEVENNGNPLYNTATYGQYGGEASMILYRDNDEAKAIFGIVLKSRYYFNRKVVPLISITPYPNTRGQYGEYPAYWTRDTMNRWILPYLTFKAHYGFGHGPLNDFEEGEQVKLTLRLRTVYLDGSVSPYREVEVFLNEDSNEGKIMVETQFAKSVTIEIMSNMEITGLDNNIILVLEDFKITYDDSDSSYPEEAYKPYSCNNEFPGVKVINEYASDSYEFMTKFGYLDSYINFTLYQSFDLYKRVKGDDGVTRNYYDAPYLAQRLMELYEPIMSKRMQVLKLDVRNDIHVTDNIYWDEKVYSVLAIEKHWWEEYNHIMIADLGKTPDISIPGMALANGYTLDEDLFNNPDSENPIKDKPEKRKVTAITLNATSISGNKGEGYQLVATVEPERVTDPTLAWTSSNESVATVNEDGYVTFVGSGSCSILCTAVSGGVQAVCSVAVISKVTSITLNETSIEKTGQGTVQLVATVLPEDANDRSVTWTWSSSDIPVATVDSNGLVTIFGVGTSVITCKANDGSGVQATCTVKGNATFTYNGESYLHYIDELFNSDEYSQMTVRVITSRQQFDLDVTTYEAVVEISSTDSAVNMVITQNGKTKYKAKFNVGESFRTEYSHS